MRRTLALLSALLLAGGCSNDGEQPPPAATVPSEVTTSSTAPAAPDPAVIPDDLAEIDEEYVQAVVDELFAVEAKAAEIFIATRDPLDERALEYLRAIYTEDEFQSQQNVWFQSLAVGYELLCWELCGTTSTDSSMCAQIASTHGLLVIIRKPRLGYGTGPIFLGLTPKSVRQMTRTV